VVAKIRDEDGKTSTVNLGSKSKIDQLNLSQGDEVQIVGRPTKINGKPAMVADEVMADGKKVDVSPPKQTASRDSIREASREGGDRDQSRESGPESSSQPQAALGIAVGEGDRGVVVLGVHPDSPATDKGLQAGDEIISFNDNAVDSPEGLVERIRELTPGDNVRLKIRREGDEQTMQIKLTKRSKLIESLR
jgi:PDZ domain-containing secreted protein